MHIKKARTSLTSELERSLFRLFTLWAFSCGFTLVAAQSNVLLLSTVNISAFAVSASEISSVISTSSSTSAQASFDVNRTNSSSLNSLHNKSGVLTALQSSNFAVVGSTEPITLALSFITTSTTTAPSVPRSVTSLLDASSFSIAGFTEPLSLALFTSESLSKQSVAASLSPSNSLLRSSSSVLSSLHATNASSSLHAAATASINITTSRSSSGETTFSNSRKLPSSYASKLRISSTHDQSTNSARSPHSSQQHLSSEVSDKLSTSRQVTTETHSNSQSFINNGIRSPVHTVSKHTGSLPSSSASVSYQAHSEVIRTSPTFLETSLTTSDAATSLVPSLSGAVLANSSTFKASNTIILPDSTTVPGQSLSSSAVSVSSISVVSSTRALKQIPFTILSQTQTFRNTSVVTLISSGPSLNSYVSSQSSSVRFSWTSSDSLKLETATVQATLNNSSIPSSYSGDRALSTSSLPNINTALLPKISDLETGAVVTSLSASREVYTAATGSKTFIPTSSTAGSSTASLAFHSHNSSSIVTPATLMETTVTSSVVVMASTSSSLLTLNSSVLLSFISNAAVLSSTSFAHHKPSSTEFSSSFISAIETRNLSTYLPSSTSGPLSATPLVSAATLPLKATTLHDFASTRNVTKISHYLSQSESTIYVNSTVQALATASFSESSNSSLTDNVTSSLDASRLSTSTLRVVVSGSRISTYVSTDFISSSANIAANVTSDQSVPRLSAYFSTSLLQQSNITHSFTIATSSGISLERVSTHQSGLHHSTEIPVSSLKSGAATLASALHSRSVGTREESITVLLSSYALSENSSHVASDRTHGVNGTAVFSTPLSQIQSISNSPSYSRSEFHVSSMPPYLIASIVRISSLGTVQSSTIQPSSTSSFGSLKFSTSSSSLLITSAVFSPSPLPSTYMSRSSLIVETESSFPRWSISSESAQLYTLSSRKSLELSSSIFASRTESSLQTLHIAATISSVNKSATPSDHQHSPSYNVPVSGTSNSLLRSPGFTSTVISENVSATTSFHKGPSSSDSVTNSSPVFMSSSLHVEPSSSDSVTHLSPVTMSSSLHTDPLSSDSVTNSSPVTMSSLPHVDPSSGYSVTHSSPVTMSSLPHVDPSSGYSVTHSSPVTMSSSLHVDPSSGYSVTHSSPVTMSSLPHVYPSSGYSVTHSSPVTMSSLPHVDPSSGYSVTHSSPVTMSSSLHVDPSSSDSVTHSNPVLMSSSLHVDPSSSDSVTHSSLVMMSSSLHVDPSSSDSVTHSSLVMMSSSLHVDPSSSDSVTHSSLVMMSSSLHVDPSSSDSVTHSSLAMMSSSLHVDPSSSDSVTHVSPVLLSTSLQASFTSGVRQSRSEPSFVTSLTQSIVNESVVHKLSSATITATTSFAQSLSSSNPYTLTSVPVVTSRYIASSSSLRPSSAGVVVTSSAVVIPPGFFVRFGVNVPLNKSVSDALFKQQLSEGILAVYQNGSTDGMLRNTSVKIINIVRSPDSNSTNVTVTFQVLNGSEPLLGYSVIQGFDQASYTLAQAVGYQMIQDPVTVHLSSTSSTMLMTSAMSVSSFKTTKASRPSFTSEVRQSSSDASFVSSLTQSTGNESVVHNPSSIIMRRTTSLSQLILTGVPVVTSSYMVSSSSSAGVVVTSSAVVIPPGFFVRFGINVPLNKSVSDALFKQQLSEGILAVYENGSTNGMLGNTSVKIINILRSPDSNSTNVTVTFQVLNGSEPLLGYSVIQGFDQASYTLAQAVGYQVIQDPIIVHLSSISSAMLMTSTIPVSSFQTTNVSRTSFTSEVRQSSSDAAFVSSLTQSIGNESVVHNSSSVKTSLSQSILTGVPVVTSSYIVSSSSLRPSSAGVVVTSSAVVILPGFFVRFGINVPLNKSVSDASFKQQLREGIHAVYQNGSTDGMLRNTAVKIINILRSPDSNSTNVTVTFQVLNGSEPLLGYSVIQGFDQASYTLGQAVGYQVIQDLIIVHLSSTSSTMLMTSTMSVSSFQTTNVSRASFTTEVRQSSSEASFVTSLTQSILSVNQSVVHESSLPLSIFSALSRLLSINTASSDTSSYFVSTSETRSLLSSGSPSGRVSSKLALSTSFQNLRTVLLSSVKVIHSTTTQQPTPQTISMTEGAFASSRTVLLLSSSSMLLPESSGSTLLLLTSSVPLTQPSLLLSTSYTVSGHSASSVTTFPSLNLSSATTKVTETQSTIQRTSSVALKLSSFTSSLTTTVPDSITPRKSSSSPAMLSASSPYFKLTVLSTTSLNSSLSSSVTTEHQNFTTTAVQVSSIPARNVSSTPDVSFPPGYTAVIASTVTPMTTRAANASGTSGLTTPSTLMSLPSPSAPPNISSAAVSLMSSFTSVEPLASRVSMLSSLQTFSSTYPLHTSSPASLSSGGLSTAVQSLTTTQLKTSNILSQPLNSSAFSRRTSVLPFNISKSTTYLSLETMSSSSVSMWHSVPSVSASSKLTTRVSPSAFKTSIPTTLVVIPSSRISIATTASDKGSRTASTHSLIPSSQELSQTTDTFFFIRTIEMSSSRFLIAATSVKSHIVEASSGRSLTAALPSKSVIHLRSSAIVASSEVTSSSEKAIKTTVSSIRTKELSSPGSTVPVGRITLTSNSLGGVETGIISVVLTKSFPPTSTQLLSSSLVHARSSFPILSSFATPAVTSGMRLGSTLVTEKSLKLSSVYVREISTTKSFASTMSLSTVSLYLTSARDAATKLTPGSVSTVSRTSSSASTSVEPTEPIRPTTNPNNTEGLVGIQILVPTTHNETTSSFREEIELRLAAAYRWGDEKARTRTKRDLASPVTLNGKNLNLWKRSATFKVYEKRARRYRRQVDNIVALAETIRRAKSIVGEEIVDIEYRIFDGIVMLSAEHIVETMNRLSEAELVSVMKYGVTLRPYVVKDIKVEPTPRARTKWETLIPAIIVPVVVIVFLCLAFAFARFAARRKRKQQNVEPDKEHPYENLEVRVPPSHDDIPPKSKHGPPKKKRSRSISSTSSHEIPPKCPTLPIPDYSPGPSDIPGKPNQQYRRRTGGRGGDHRNKKDNHPAMDGDTGNGHLQRERAVKKSRDVKDNIEMEHLAGVVENRPQMRDEKLASSLKRPDPPVKFMSLPPLVQTPLVGPKPSIPHTSAEEKKEHDRIIAESGVPQALLDEMKMIALQYTVATKETDINEDEDELILKANVERWRNKMRHREKLRQDMREKERKKGKKLKKLEKEGKSNKEKDVVEDQSSTLSRSLTAERKRRSRLDRWRNNRVGTSSSKSSGTSSSSSSSSSSEGDSDAETKHEKDKEKKNKDKNNKAKVPPLATGQAAKATARDALRETAWTIKETPGVRLVSVRPINEAQQGQQERSPQPVYPQNGVQGQKPPPTQHRDRVHYLLETGYPALPVIPTPLIRPPETQDLNDDLAYEDMEGLDPYTVQYNEHVYYPRARDAFIRSSVPAEPRQAFSNPSFHEGEHIYEEPMVTPASLPQTHFESPQDNQAGVLISTSYASGYAGRVPVTKGRPTSASEHPGSARQTSARPTSTRTEPIARYAPPPGRRSPPNRSLAPSVPGSRYMLANRPTVATALQPSIGTSPRYMVDPGEQKEEPPSFFDGAHAILSRAQANVDRFEKDSRSHASGETDAVTAPERLYAKPPRKTPSHARAALKEPSLTGSSRLDVAAREHAELEAQLLVSRALARARNNVRV